jgi:hypothetical protein
MKAQSGQVNWSFIVLLFALILALIVVVPKRHQVAYPLTPGEDLTGHMPVVCVNGVQYYRGFHELIPKYSPHQPSPDVCP